MKTNMEVLQETVQYITIQTFGRQKVETEIIREAIENTFLSEKSMNTIYSFAIFAKIEKMKNPSSVSLAEVDFMRLTAEVMQHFGMKKMVSYSFVGRLIGKSAAAVQQQLFKYKNRTSMDSTIALMISDISEDVQKQETLLEVAKQSKLEKKVDTAMHLINKAYGMLKDVKNEITPKQREEIAQFNEKVGEQRVVELPRNGIRYQIRDNAVEILKAT